eukprot:jgi/Orpsp1_1/1186026/evm.model.c7180000096542.1
MIEISIDELSNVLKNYDIIQFKEYLKNRKIIKLNALNTLVQDILIFAIYCESSTQILNFIIRHCQYENLNYEVYRFFKDGLTYSPLSMAIQKENFKIANFLINYPDYYYYNNSYTINSSSNTYNNNNNINNRARTKFYPHITDNYTKNKYIINVLPLNIFDIHVLVWNFIRRSPVKEKERERERDDYDDLFKQLFDIHIFNNTFILGFLNAYQQKWPLLNTQINEAIQMEKIKLCLNIQ